MGQAGIVSFSRRTPYGVLSMGDDHATALAEPIKIIHVVKPAKHAAEMHAEQDTYPTFLSRPCYIGYRANSQKAIGMVEQRAVPVR
ncbi:hypothetical protein MB02_11315 [Croceicoccus estronivorus]|nr:hypothetical protein MB02_11315 [Croceicoccus estronivorus]